jgi:hypothetical protein
MATTSRPKIIKRGEGTYLRSNRPLTEFACTHLGLFLAGRFRDSGKRSQGNTTVVYSIGSLLQHFTVYLFEQPVLRVSLSVWKPVSVQVAFTSFFDREGRPTLTTCERLNGLLDRLGAYRVIPQGVRVFRNWEDGTACLGKNDDWVAVGRGLAETMFIRPNADQLDIVGTLVEHEIADQEA